MIKKLKHTPFRSWTVLLVFTVDVVDVGAEFFIRAIHDAMIDI
jgi:hypothetical protein